MVRLILSLVFVSAAVAIGFHIVLAGDPPSPELKGKALEDELARRAAAMGKNVVVVETCDNATALLPGAAKPEVEAIRDECPAVVRASPVLCVGGCFEYMNRKYSAITGVAPEYLVIDNWKIAKGNSFTDRDFAESKRVCMLGNEAARRLFGQEDPLGKSVKLRLPDPGSKLPSTFRVVGLLAKKGTPLDGDVQMRDSLALIPWTTAYDEVVAANREVVGENNNVKGWNIVAQAGSPEKVPDAIAQIRRVLRARRHLRADQADTFEIRDQNKWIAETREFIIRKSNAPDVPLAPDAGIRELLRPDPNDAPAMPKATEKGASAPKASSP